MSDTLDPALYYRISDLPDASAITGAEVVEAIQGGKNVKFTLAQLMVAGKSAYQVAVDGGYAGTQAQWLASLVGAKGADGTNGKSAYELAVAGGYADTQANWLASLKGVKGDQGLQGIQGLKGDKGDKGDTGTAGNDGAAGKSAYESAVLAGFVGTEAQWTASLKGVKGDAGAQGAMGNGARLLGAVADQASLPPVGESQEGDCYLIGPQFWALSGGAWTYLGNLQGPDGKSAYDLALIAGFSGTADDWLASLHGADGIGLKVLGSFQTVGDLPPGPAGNTAGDAFIIDAVMWVWDGTNWVPVGQVGPDGKSAYQLAKDAGLIPGTMTLSQWITSLNGKTAFQVAQANGFVGTQAAWLQSLVGKTAYQLALDSGFVGSQSAWLATLVGPKGDQGIQGLQGIQGPMGPGVKILGTVTTSSALPGSSTTAGDMYIAADTLHGWAWTGTAFIDVGPVQGPKGDQGIQGIQGVKGDKGDKGDQGDSAYTAAVAGGFVGTQAQWLASLVGVSGDSAYQTAVDNGYVGTQAQWIASLKGAKGDVGLTGPMGRGIVIKGTVANQAALPGNPAQEDAYIVGSNLFIYVNTAWVDAGPFVGPKGDQGIQGIQGIQGVKGDKGDKGDQGDQGIQGIQGIQGVKGDLGPGIKILGTYADSSQLPAHTTEAIGDGYLIQGHFWGWTGAAFTDLGQIQGPKGDQGIQGLQGLKGDKGDKGDTGLQGIQGIQGLQGVKGDKGDTGTAGNNVKILGTVATSGDLPVSGNTQGDAYRVGDHLYSYNGTVWVDVGQWKGDKGDKGDQGLQGIQGDQGLQGVQGLKGDTGDKGDQGDTGPMGPGVKILGTVANSAALPGSATNAGDMYIASDTLHGWAWTGSAFIDVGPIQGPKGDRGLQGLQGLKGDQGLQGLKGDKGDQGTRWIVLGRDPNPADGVVGDYFLNSSTLRFFQKTTTVAWSWLGYLGGGNVYDANLDDTPYVRENGAWVPLPAPAVGEAPLDHGLYLRKDGAWTAFTPAPNDTKAYVQKTGAWVDLSTLTDTKAPNDAKAYVQKGGNWTDLSTLATVAAPNDAKAYVQKGGNWTDVATLTTPLAPNDSAYYVAYNNGTTVGLKRLDRYDLPIVATTANLDLAANQAFTVSAATAKTLAFVNAPGANRAMTVVIAVTGNAAAITWPGSISWSGGTAPTLGATYTNVILLWDGTKWTGSVGATA